MAWMSSLRSTFSAPYGLVAAFLALTLGPALGLVWLGWRSLDQDRALENQRIAECRENAADQIVAALQKSEADLAQLRAPVPEEDALIVEFHPSGIRVHPNGGLVFHPTAPVAREVSSSVYRDAEAHEFQRQDYRKASWTLRILTRSPESSIRAGAYLRMARNQRKAGLSDEALRTYTELATCGQAAIAGFPAELSVFNHSRSSEVQQIRYPPPHHPIIVAASSRRLRLQYSCQWRDSP